MGVRGECFTRDPRREQPELHGALHTVAVVRLPQGICHRLDEPKAASDLGGISGAEPIHQDGELEAAANRDAERATEPMAPLLEAIEDEIIVCKGKDVGRRVVQATPPSGAALPFTRP